MDFSMISLAAKYAVETLRADRQVHDQTGDIADVEIRASFKQDGGLTTAYDVVMIPHGQPGPRTVIATVWA